MRVHWLFFLSQYRKDAVKTCIPFIKKYHNYISLPANRSAEAEALEAVETAGWGSEGPLPKGSIDFFHKAAIKDNRV